MKLARSIYLRVRCGRAARLSLGGASWWVPVQDKYFTPALLLLGSYEPTETRFVRQTVTPGMVALDIGAHVGYYTCLLASLASPGGRVFAFEPMPLNRRLLRRNVAQQAAHSVTIVPFAASHETGSHTLYLSANNSGDNRLTPHAQPGHQVTIQMVRLDDYLSAPTRVDFVKMDVQGWEWHVLKGMTSLLDANPRIVILLEIWPAGLAQAGSSVDALAELCEHHGLALHRFDAAHPDRLVRVGAAEIMAASGPFRDSVNAVAAAPDRLSQIRSRSA